MSTRSRRTLTRAIHRIVRQSATTGRPVPKYAAPPALLSLLLLSQPALAQEAQVEAQF